METTVTLEMMQHDEVLMREFTDQAIEALYNFYEWLECNLSRDIEYKPRLIVHDWTEFLDKSEVYGKYGASWEDDESLTIINIGNGILVMDDEHSIR